MEETPEKRHKRQFEPPPWEREQFEQLHKELGDEPAESGPAEHDEVSATQAPSGVPALATGAPVQEVPKAEPRHEERPVSPESQANIDLMLLQLNAQEPKIQKEVWAYAAASAIVVGILGVALLMYSLVAAVRIKDSATMAGWFGVIVILAFGGLMIAGAIWMGMRSARLKRGEL